MFNSQIINVVLTLISLSFFRLYQFRTFALPFFLRFYFPKNGKSQATIILFNIVAVFNGFAAVGSRLSKFVAPQKSSTFSIVSITFVWAIMFFGI